MDFSVNHIRTLQSGGISAPLQTIVNELAGKGRRFNCGRLRLPLQFRSLLGIPADVRRGWISILERQFTRESRLFCNLLRQFVSFHAFHCSIPDSFDLQHVHHSDDEEDAKTAAPIEPARTPRTSDNLYDGFNRRRFHYHQHVAVRHEFFGSGSAGSAERRGNLPDSCITV